MTNFIAKDDLDLYACLGLMVRASADLELRLQMMCISLSESPYAHLWIHGTRTEAAAKLVKNLAEANPKVTPEEYAALDGLIKRLGPLTQRRHGYVHGAWSVDQSDPAEPAYQAMRYTKGQMLPRFDPISKADLGDLVAQFSDLTSELMEWLAAYLRKSQHSDSE